MDGPKSSNSISPRDLYDRLGTAQAPILIDVRKPADYAASDRCIVSAVLRAPDQTAIHGTGLVAGQLCVSCCRLRHHV